MPITSDLGGKGYTLGRGRLYFNRFTAAQVAAGIVAATKGEGERYIGNTPDLSMSSSEESLDHFDSDTGVRVKDDSVSLQLDRNGSFVTDNIGEHNLALYFLSDGAATLTQNVATGATYVILGAKRGLFYQIGETTSLPAGVRKISTVTVGKGASYSTSVAASGNWEVDEELGRIYILPAATDIPDNTDIQVTYNLAAATRTEIVSSSDSLYGSLHFVADNPKGANRDYLWPYVKLTPDGDFNLKGDDWQSMTFAFEVLRKATNIEAVYVNGRATAT